MIQTPESRAAGAAPARAAFRRAAGVFACALAVLWVVGYGGFLARDIAAIATLPSINVVALLAALVAPGLVLAATGALMMGSARSEAMLATHTDAFAAAVELVRGQAEKLDAATRAMSVRAEMLEGLSGESDAIGEAADRAAMRSLQMTEMSAGLRRQSKDLERVSGLIEERLKGIRTLIDHQAAALDKAVLKVDTRAREASEWLRSQIDDMVATVERTTGSAEKIRTVLHEQAAAIEAAAADAARQAEDTCGALARQTQAAQDAGQQLLAHAREAGEIVRTDMQELQRRVELVAGEAGRAAAEMGRAAHDAVRTVSDASEELAGRMVATTRDFEATAARAEAAGARMTTAAQTFAREAKSVESGAEAAQARLAGTAEELRRAGATAEEMLDAIAARTQAAETTIDGWTQRVARIVGEIQTQVDDVVAQCITREKDLTSVFGDADGRVRQLEQSVREAVTQLSVLLDEANTTLGDTKDSLVAQIREIAGAASTSRTALSEGADELADRADTLRTRALSAGTALSEQVEVLRTKADAAGTGLAAAGDALKDRIEAIAGGAERAEATLGQAAAVFTQAGAALVKHASVLGREAEEAGRALGTASEMVREQIGVVREAATEASESLVAAAIEAVQKTTAEAESSVAKVEGAFETQTGALREASEEARRQAEALVVADTEGRRSRFLKTSRSAIESLNSLGIDLARALDDKGTERLLREYMEGNRGGFIKHLLKIDFGAVGAQIRNRYAENREFRRCIDEYIEEYERLISEARQADLENVLVVSLLTSDVGKLYMVLCDVLARRPARTA